VHLSVLAECLFVIRLMDKISVACFQVFHNIEWKCPCWSWGSARVVMFVMLRRTYVRVLTSGAHYLPLITCGLMTNRCVFDKSSSIFSWDVKSHFWKICACMHCRCRWGFGELSPPKKGPSLSKLRYETV